MNAGDDSAAQLITSLTRQVADFPSAGIQFKDLTPLFADPRGLAAVTDELADAASGADLIAGIDARGFLIGGAVAARRVVVSRISATVHSFGILTVLEMAPLMNGCAAAIIFKCAR